MAMRRPVTTQHARNDFFGEFPVATFNPPTCVHFSAASLSSLVIGTKRLESGRAVRGVAFLSALAYVV